MAKIARLISQFLIHHNTHSHNFTLFSNSDPDLKYETVQSQKMKGTEGGKPLQFWLRLIHQQF